MHIFKTSVTGWLLAACASCASAPAIDSPNPLSDPPMRGFAELPSGLSGAPGTEMDLVRAIQDVYVGAGYPEARAVTEVVWSDAVIGSSHHNGLIRLRRIHTGADGARRYWEDVAGSVLAGRALDFAGWTEDDVTAGYQVFMTALAAHEIAHVISARRGSHDSEDYPTEEDRVRACEMPVLVRLAALGRIPERWLALYPRVLEAFIAAVPEPAKALVRDAPDRRALYAWGYGDFVYGNITDEARAALSIAFESSLERAREPEVDLASLAFTFEPAPLDPAETLKDALFGLSGVASEYTDDCAFTLTLEAHPDWRGVALCDRGTRTYGAVVAAPLSVPPARVAAVDRLLAAANLLSDGGVLVIEEGLLEARSSSRGAVGDLVTPAVELLSDWVEPFALLAQGKLDVARARELGVTRAVQRRDAPLPEPEHPLEVTP